MDDRFGMLELDEEAKKAQPNSDIFTDVDSLQVREGATAKQDANGTWFNAIGLESSETHRHVAKVWQDKCTPFSDFLQEVKDIVKTKSDIVKPESEIRFKDVSTLVDGTPINQNGINSLRMFTDIPTSMLSYLIEKGYDEEVVKFFNNELDLREQNWANDGKEPRDFRIRMRENVSGVNEIRAIVSERYGVIDNHDAIQMIADALPTLKDALASHLDHNGDDMYGNILLPDHIKSQPDSDYGVGIAFRNSEIRNSTLRVSPFLFRAICLNGMIWGRKNSEININQKHLGTIDKDHLRVQIKKAVAVALTEGNCLLTLMDHAKSVKVANPLNVIAQLTRDNNMTIEQGRAWHKGYLDSLAEETGDHNDKTAFGVVNGLTRSAQFYKGATREQMETTASFILSPSIDADLQAISKRWGRISDNASQLSEKMVNQYQYVAV